MKWIAKLRRFRPQNQPSVLQLWIDHDQAEAGTPYWDHITDTNQEFRIRLAELLNRYPIDFPGKEFIVHPEVAVELTDKLDTLGIAVWYVSVWCHVPPHVPQEECCPEGRGGPSRQTSAGMEWFSEYTHLGYEVPNFEQMPSTRDLASRCNPLVKHYLQVQLHQERAYNEHFRVSLGLYIPLQWDLIAHYP